MPRGPKGEKRPDDAIGNAVMASKRPSTGPLSQRRNAQFGRNYFADSGLK
jgi:hypothetical protein